MKSKFYFNKGFTIVETLVAITVLMIAVAGPLVVANKGLVAALYSKDQAIASFLAQEGVELLRNFKDGCIYNTGVSGCKGFVDSPTSALSFDHVMSTNNCAAQDCTISINPNVSQNGDKNIPIQISSVFNENEKVLYSFPSNCPIAYSHVSILTCDGGSSVSGNQSIFKRYFRVKKISNDEYQVIMTVTWNERTVPNAVEYNTQLVSEVL